MLCKIADLYARIPETGGMTPRLRDYATQDKASPDIVIREEKYDASRWPHTPKSLLPYMDSGFLFYAKLLCFGGMMLHASAVELDGRAYLFSGPSGIGKSTHAHVWEKAYGARIFNDDKPALRERDGVWYAYGTPWCGKSGININLRAPVAGICFLRRGACTVMRRLDPLEAAAAIISQTNNRFEQEQNLNILVDTVEKLIFAVPIYELTGNCPAESARLSYQTMLVR